MDAAGNFTSMADFKTGHVVRFTSYLDPNVILGMRGNPGAQGATSAAWDAVVRHVDDGGSVQEHTWLIVVDDAGMLRLGYLDDDGMQLGWVDSPGFPTYMTMQDSRTPDGYVYVVDPDLTRFTIDWVDGCWFALNNHDRTRVIDVAESDTAVGANIIGFRWNGGDNQKWRCNEVSGE